MEKPRCLWCHRYHDIMYEKMVPVINRVGIAKGEENEFFCSEECYQDADRFLKRCARYSIPSLIFLFLMLAVIFNSFWLEGLLNVNYLYLLAFSIVCIGGLLEVIPFTTPETVRYVGLKKGTWMSRGIGLFLITLGLLLFYLGRALL